MLWSALVKLAQDEALKALRRIGQKLENLEEKTIRKMPQKNQEGAKIATGKIEILEDISAEKRAVNRDEEKPQNFSEQLGNKITLEMIYLPGGKFIMGSTEGEGRDYERPQHQVTIKPFFMGKFPITQAQWQEFMGDNPADFQDRPLNPVENVTWNYAQEFCRRLSKKTGKKYRLPTEAEWEYACRAATTTPYYFGEALDKELANYGGSSTKEVGSYPANEFGLYDLHGNVAEWCEDDWHKNYEGAPTDGSAWLSENSKIKVMRGGSWLLNPGCCRSAHRTYGKRDDYYMTVGFRVACFTGRTT